MTTPTKEPTNERLDEILRYHESGVATPDESKELADQFRRMRDENQTLRVIFPRILERLKSGACAPDCSLEFLARIPDEVGGVTDKLRADLLSWQGNCQRMADQHGELSKELGQALSDLAARDALCAELREALEIIRDYGMTATKEAIVEACVNALAKTPESCVAEIARLRSLACDYALLADSQRVLFEKKEAEADALRAELARLREGEAKAIARASEWADIAGRHGAEADALRAKLAEKQAEHSELHRYLLKCTLREGAEREQSTTMDLLQELHARCIQRGEDLADAAKSGAEVPTIPAVTKIDIGACPIPGWEGAYIRIHFTDIA